MQHKGLRRRLLLHPIRSYIKRHQLTWLGNDARMLEGRLQRGMLTAAFVASPRPLRVRRPDHTPPRCMQQTLREAGVPPAQICVAHGV